jgi:hypothetical protein
MAMKAESLEVLEQASVPPAQARAFLRAIEIELAGAQDTLATKHDILLLRQDMEIGRGELRVEMAEQGAAIRGEMAQQGGDLRAEMHRGFSSVTRQIYMAVLGQIVVMLGFSYFFMLQLR